MLDDGVVVNYPITVVCSLVGRSAGLDIMESICLDLKKLIIFVSFV